MKEILDIIQNVLNLGAAVMLPIVITILGLIFRMSFGNAFKSGLLVGIGFQGLSLTIDLLTKSVRPAVAYYKHLGQGFTTVDVGWAAVGAASWGVPFAALAVLLIVLINFILIMTKVTKVMNIDIWNYIHFLVPGTLAYALSGSFWLGLIITVGLSVISLIAGQIVAPKWEKYYGLEGTTCTTLSYIILAYPIGLFTNWLVEHIPGLNKIHISMGQIDKKLGFLGNPAVIGVIVGIFLGIMTKQSWQTDLTIAMGISSVLVLIPKMVSVMMEGLSAIGDATQTFMRKKVGSDSKLYIGMDVALSLGDPTNVTVSVLLIPVAILFAFLIPHMNYFPVGMLTSIVYMIPLVSLACKGDLFKTIIGSVIMLLISEIGANVFSPEATAMMHATGIKVSGMVTDGFFGYNLPNVIISLIHRLLV